jgi:hypothetical protein
MSSWETNSVEEARKELGTAVPVTEKSLTLPKAQSGKENQGSGHLQICLSHGEIVKM